MAKQDLSALSLEALESALRQKRTLLRTVAGIFGVIVLAWVVLGYWRENTPVFISTVAIAVAVTASAWASVRGLERELRRRHGG